jgi:DNA-directed RNA polymerase specialized sigma subunit
MSKKKLNINKKEMYDEMVISMWQQNPTDKLIKMFSDMSVALANQFVYVIQEDRNDVVAFALAGLLERYYKFDFNKTNPFSYYTQTITNLIINSFGLVKRDAEFSIDAILTSDNEE